MNECYRGSSVRVFRLDAQLVRRRLRVCAERLLALRADVSEVRLFGSLARGEGRPGSDADLFVTLRETNVPFLQRPPDLARHFAGVGVGVDILAYTKSEVEGLRAQRSAFLSVVFQEGIVLAARPSKWHGKR